MIRYSAVLFVLLAGTLISAAADEPVGTLRGRILNFSTKAPVAGATISIDNLQKGAVSDARGEFMIASLSVGGYTVRIRSIGFEPIVEPDVIIRSERTTFLERELVETAIETEELTVYGGYFRSAAVTPVSTMEMSAEELRRAPGSAGDINRALYAIPGIVQVDDEANDLVVRGGAPFENGFYIDNIFTPNINHFPQQGASGGNIAMLNIDFIDNVAVSTGGFDASYGNRLSSIVDIRLREGNRDAYDGQIDLNMTGFGGSVEGPIGGDASFLLSAKHSYFDLITDILDLGLSPRFYDVQGKVSFAPAAGHTVTVLDVFGRSEFRRDRATAVELDEPTFGREVYLQNTAGANWRAVWSGGYSNTAFSYAVIDAENDWSRLADGAIADRHSYTDRFYTLRNTTSFLPGLGVSLDIGGEWQLRSLTATGVLNGGEHTRSLDHSTAAVFASVSRTFFDRLTLQIGGRLVYGSGAEHTAVEPRAKLVFAADEALSFHAAYALVHQELPPFLTVQDPANEKLGVPRAQHLVAGFNYLLSDDIRLTVEGYSKEYAGFPLSPLVPFRFVVDDVAGDDSDYDYYGALISDGEAYTRGVELTLQKKFSGGLYGIIGGTYFRSRYRDLTGEWRNRMFDNRYVATISAGWKPDDNWELSFRWVYAGGKAYTPIDVEQSRRQGRTVRDLARIMDAYYPAYHSLNLRVDRRFYFMNTTLILYVNLLNAYNRANVRSYYWDASREQVRANTMLPLIPVLGVEYEF